MSTWRKKAVEIIKPPKPMAKDLQNAKTLYMFWFEVWSHFEKAQTSHQNDLVTRIYNYAFWCLNGAGIVAVLDYFFRRLPESATAREQMFRNISREDFHELRAEFAKSNLTLDEFKTFEESFTLQSQNLAP